MAARERPAPALGDDHVDDPPEPTAAALAEAAEAEALAAEAEARAAEARAHAVRLHRRAIGNTGPVWRRWLRRPGRRDVAVAAAIAVVGTALATSGYLLWHHRVASQQRQHAAEFIEAARQATVTFMSLDFNNTGEDMKRIGEISTGPLKERLPAITDELTKRLQESKVVTIATVNEVGIESMTDDSAVVLVAATTDARRSDGGKQEPQSWHIALSMTREGGQAKMSNIEFVQ